MQQTMSESLPNSGQNKYFKLWKETEGDFKEKRTAVFIESLKEFAFTPKDRPKFPFGYESDHDDCRNIEDARRKSEAFKLLRDKYFSYFLELDSVESENRSNLAYLKDAKEWFESIEMAAYALRVQEKINAFR